MNNKGFSLIEIIIYLALFSIIIGGGMVGVYQIIQSNQANLKQTIIEQEANFLLRKINWALTGATEVTVPDPQTLDITKGGISYLFELNGNYMQLNGVDNQLNSDNAPIENLTFEPTDPVGIKATITINGRPFTTTKYLRATPTP